MGKLTNGDDRVRWVPLQRSRPERLIVDTQIRARMHPDSPFQVPRLVESFVALGRAGGLAGAGLLPADSRVEVQGRRLDAVSAHFDLALDGIDPCAVGVLFNSLVFSHRMVEPVELLSISSSFDERVCLAPLAGTAGVLPFDTDLEINSDDVLITASFCEVPDGKAQAQIEADLAAWLNLLASGGFETDIWLATKPFAVSQDDPWWLGRELSLRLEGASFDEAALDSLVNVFRVVHQRVVAVESVVVG